MMQKFEKIFWDKNELVLGLDEAGRGPLAGPLVVAGVIFPMNYQNSLINDSKKISEKKREVLYKMIVEDALAFFIEIIEPEVVDELNVYAATKKGMTDIILCAKANHVLTDAMPIALLDVEVIDIVKGDQKSISIAAASILAKVTRDRIMLEYDQLYPEYNFKKHKGYPTKDHLQRISQYGVLPFYRKSYNPIKKMIAEGLFNNDEYL